MGCCHRRDGQANALAVCLATEGLPLSFLASQRSRPLVLSVIQAPKADLTVLPANAMLLLGFLVATIIVHMKILTRRTKRFMAKVVANKPQIDLLIGHM